MPHHRRVRNCHEELGPNDGVEVELTTRLRDFVDVNRDDRIAALFDDRIESEPILCVDCHAAYEAFVEAARQDAGSSPSRSPSREAPPRSRRERVEPLDREARDASPSDSEDQAYEL